MKYTVLGPRILLKVVKFTKKDPTSKIMLMEETISQETAAQTVGEVIQLGTTAYKRNDIGCDGTPWVKLGDRVHFNRYGAVRLNIKDSEDSEFWVIMDKDILCIESVEEEKEMTKEA